MPAKRLIFILFVLGNLHAQSNNYLEFVPVYDQQVIAKNKYYNLDNNDSIQFNTLKFYISGIQLFKNGKKIWIEENSYHLVDVFDLKHLGIKVPDIQFDKINFFLGLDSIVNTSGALGGDLDPTIGMYWAWQSGYINAKVEGKYKNQENKVDVFSYHLGGYLSPFTTIQSLELELKSIIFIDLSAFIKNIDFNNQKDVMSPGPDAAKLASILGKCFKPEK